MDKKLNIGRVGSVVAEEAAVAPQQKGPPWYERWDGYMRIAINTVLSLLEFSIIAFILVIMITYGYKILVNKDYIAFVEAKKAIETINSNWKAALVLIGFILSRIILKKLYDLKIISKEKAEFENGNRI